MLLFNILIIDDQKFKLLDIMEHVDNKKVIVDYASDVYSSIELIKAKRYNLIFLDITLRENGSKNEFKGIDILDFLDNEEIDSPVIILTQFFNFNDLSMSVNQRGYYEKNHYFQDEVEYNFSTDLDLHYLPNLHMFLSQNYYLNYFGCILYIQNDIIWVDCLKKLMSELGGKKYESIVIR